MSDSVEEYKSVIASLVMTEGYRNQYCILLLRSMPSCNPQSDRRSILQAKDRLLVLLIDQPESLQLAIP